MWILLYLADPILIPSLTIVASKHQISLSQLWDFFVKRAHFILSSNTDFHYGSFSSILW